jgi:hypothetical protein
MLPRAVRAGAQPRHVVREQVLHRTALGFAVHEGLVGMDTRLAELFSEYTPKKPDARWGELTIEHLVTMTAGKSPPFLSPKGPRADWIQTYIDAPWYNAPGAENRYINEKFFMLSAALQRATGQPMMDYFIHFGWPSQPEWLERRHRCDVQRKGEENI